MRCKWFGTLVLAVSLLVTNVPRAEAGFFITNIITAPFKVAGKVVKKTAGTVVKKGGKAVIKNANPVTKVRRTQRVLKHIKRLK